MLTPLTEAAIFLVLTVNAGGEETTRDLLADLSGLKRSVGFRIQEGELTCVTGIGSELWDRLFDGPRPAELHVEARRLGRRRCRSLDIGLGRGGRGVLVLCHVHSSPNCS